MDKERIKHLLSMILMVALCNNDIKHFIIQLMHTT